MSDPSDNQEESLDQLDLEQRYSNWQELGQGGMGKVFVAHDKMLDKSVAIKLLHSDVDSRAVVRFQQEAKALSKLSHKYIVKIMDFHYSKSGQLFLVMEKIEGCSLESILDEKGKLPPDEALNIAIQLSQALNHAHTQGIVHRDLKPANVMIDKDQNAKILDFGIAKLISGSDIFGTLTKAGQLIGSPLFMSPEQLKGEAANELSDVYGLGLLLFTMITGSPAFEGPNLMESLQHRLEETAPSVSAHVPDEKLCAGLDAIIKRALHPDPAERFSSMAEFESQLSSLKTVSIQSDDVDSPTTVEHRPKVRIDRRTVLIVLVILAGLAAVAVIGYQYYEIEARKVRTAENTTPPEILPGSAKRLAKKAEREEPLLDLNTIKKPKLAPLEGFFLTNKMERDFWVAPDPMTEDEMTRLEKSSVMNLSFSGGEHFNGSILKRLPVSQMRGLILDRTKVNDEDLKAIGRMKKLTYLDLRKTEISDKGIKYLAPLTELVKLEIDGCKNVTSGAIPTLMQLPKLRAILMSNTGLTRDGVIKLQADKKLRRVGFGGSDITDDDIIKFEGLWEIRIAGCKNITDKTLDHFARDQDLRNLDVARCPKVTMYGINHFKTTRPGFKHFNYSPPVEEADTEADKDALDFYGVHD